jgi:pyruvoyl-dependent arginine decarboxylase (PvlArgDC)
VSALKSAGAPLNVVEAHIETAEEERVVGTVEVVEVIYGQEVGGYVNECKSKAEDAAAETIQNVGKNLLNDIAGEDDDLRTRRLKLLQVVEGDD